MSECILKICNLNLFYRVFGKGDPIFILHGWGGVGASWVSIAQTFAHDGYRVYVLDLPGFGKSDVPNRPWAVDDYAECILAMMKHLHIPSAHFLGHSFGGRICIKLAARHQKSVKKLILCASAGIRPPITWKYTLCCFLAKIGRTFFSLPFLNLFASFFRRLLYRMVGSKDYLDAGKNKETFQKVIAEDLQPYLSHIQAETLLIWGEKDKMTPIRDAYIMKENIPHARLVVFPEVTHAVHLHAPFQLTASVLEFLQHS